MFIIFCFAYKHLALSNKPYQPEKNFIENKYLPGLLMSFPLLHVTISHNLANCGELHKNKDHRKY